MLLGVGPPCVLDIENTFVTLGLVFLYGVEDCFGFENEHAGGPAKGFCIEVFLRGLEVWFFDILFDGEDMGMIGELVGAFYVAVFRCGSVGDD